MRACPRCGERYLWTMRIGGVLFYFHIADGSKKCEEKK